jgi:Zn-dependent protease
VAAAGPLANIILAVGAGLLLHFTAFFPSAPEAWLERTLQNGIFVNLLLAVFNMLPIPPLDGGRVAVGLLPVSLARPLARLERYGFFILLLVMLGLPALFEAWGGQFSLFGTIILPVIDTLYNVVTIATGHI